MSCPICYREKCVVEHGAVAAQSQIGNQCRNDCQQQQAHQGQVVSALTAVPAEPAHITLLVDRLGFVQTRDDVHGIQFNMAFERNGANCVAIFLHDPGDVRNTRYTSVYRETDWEAVPKLPSPEGPPPGVLADKYTANLRTSLERAVAELSDAKVLETELLAENARLRRMVEKKR
jgi:hypothetical protein